VSGSQEVGASLFGLILHRRAERSPLMNSHPPSPTLSWAGHKPNGNCWIQRKLLAARSMLRADTHSEERAGSRAFASYAASKKSLDQQRGKADDPHMTSKVNSSLASA
jgi:hypothetical protein